jgi:hypothetical protein
MTTLTISTNGIGQSEDELNQLLISNYLKILIKINKAPDKICLYSEGVKIACVNSNVLEELNTLKKMGSEIILCKTCVEYFNLIDQVMMGSIGTMMQILEYQLKATHNLNP